MTDVIDAGINFLHPDVTQAAPSTDPAESQQGSAATPSTETAPTATQQEPQRKYAGKYTSVEELERGYWNSAQEAQRLVQENKLLKELQTSQQRANPTERRESRQQFIEELSEAAVPVDALTALIKEEARNIVQETFAPVLRGAQARNEMLEQFPGFDKAERNLNNFLSANPDVNDKYNRLMNAGLEDVALEFAYRRFKDSQPQQTTDVSGQEQAAARATAALTGTSVGAREVGDSFNNALERARARFALDGDERALAAVVLGGIHPDIAQAR